MKKVFVFSIQHTGTFFTSDMLGAGTPSKTTFKIGSLFEKHQELGHTRFIKTEPIELSDFVKPSATIGPDWFDRAVISVCTPKQISEKELIIAHEHHHKPNSWLIKALTKAKPAIPIVIPIRDPLLSLHSKLWRENEIYNNSDQTSLEARASRLAKWIEMYIEILSIPKDHIYLFPIDTKASGTKEGRIEIVKKMYKHCKLDFNKEVYKSTLAWTPKNRTFGQVVDFQHKPPKPQWENFKQHYLNGNIEHTKTFMDLEFQELKRQKHLKELMKDAGYKDVLWW